MMKYLMILTAVISFALPGFASDKAAEVTLAKGRVEVVHGDEVMGKKADPGTELIVKDILRTKRKGYAEVGFVDGTNVKVFEKSRLTINGLERTTDGYNAVIQKGKVLFKVEKMEDVAGDFRVKTTNSIIGVKGTTFGVVSGGLVTIVEVYNGHVEVLATATQEQLASGAVNPNALAGAGKGGNASDNRATLVANLTSGQGLVLSNSGDVQIYQFSGEGATGSSLLFTGAGDQGGTGGAAAGAGASGGEGGAGGTGGDAAVFGSLGNDEAGSAGGEGSGVDIGGAVSGIGAGLPTGPDSNGGAGGLGTDLSGIQNQLDTGGAGGTGGTTGDIGQIVSDISGAVNEGSDFYSSPDVKPDTPEQVDLATGTVNINIDFK